MIFATQGCIFCSVRSCGKVLSALYFCLLVNSCLYTKNGMVSHVEIWSVFSTGKGSFAQLVHISVHTIGSKLVDKWVVIWHSISYTSHRHTSSARTNTVGYFFQERCIYSAS